MFFAYWFMAWIATVIKIRVKGPFVETTQSIIVGYMVWILSPTAVLAFVYMYYDATTTHDWEDVDTNNGELENQSAVQL